MKYLIMLLFNIRDINRMMKTYMNQILLKQVFIAHFRKDATMARLG